MVSIICGLLGMKNEQLSSMLGSLKIVENFSGLPIVNFLGSC